MEQEILNSLIDIKEVIIIFGAFISTLIVTK